MKKHIRRPSTKECDEYYTAYINQVDGLDFMSVLLESKKDTSTLLSALTPEQWNFRYQPDKWTTKEVMIHILDTERIFAYRALRISRNDHVGMAGFNQDDYVPFSGANERTSNSIIEEYLAVRDSTICLFKNFSNDMYLRMGLASEKPFTPLAIGFIVAGHEKHHLRILHERYLHPA